MKLIVILSVIAYGYAAKLDRTYLPPANAATAGGSPGSLATPFGSVGKPLGQPSGQAGFGQPSGPSGFAQADGPSGFVQPTRPEFGSPAGSTEFNKPSKSSGFPSGSTNFGPSIGTSQPDQPSSSPSFSQRPVGSAGFSQSPGAPQFDQSSNALGFGPARQPATNAGSTAGPSQFSEPSGSPTFRQQPFDGVPSGKQAFGTSVPQPGVGQTLDGPYDKSPDFGLGSQGGPEATGYSGRDYQQPERPQAAADRNAEILRYDNENDGENFAYSFETSNGIAAEESGVATNGVQAQGGFSYTGDDGQFYQVTYTADENGFVPKGDHLPTPPPIPDEILRSLEENAKAAAAGTQEGAYRPEEDESDTLQTIGTGGSPSYNQPRGQDQPSNQYGAPGYKQPQNQDQSSSTSSYNRPQSQGQIPTRQYGTPSNTAQSQDQAGSQGGFDQSRNSIQSTGRQYNAPVNTNSQSQVSQKPGTSTYTQDNAATNGYSYNQPQNQGQGSKSKFGLTKTGSTLSEPQGSSNAGIQGQSSQRSGLASYDQGNAPNGGYNSNQPQNQGQGSKPQFGLSSTGSTSGSQGPNADKKSQYSGSQSYNQGNAPNNGYNYNQPQNQGEGSRPQFGLSSAGSIPTGSQGSSNAGVQSQTPQFGGSPSLNQGNAPNGGYNYNQPQKQGEDSRPQFGLSRAGSIPTGSQGSSNAGIQSQTSQFGGSPSYNQGSDTGFNYNQPETRGKGLEQPQGSPNAGSVGAGSFLNNDNQGQTNQQGQGRGLGYQASSPGNNNAGLPNQSRVNTDSQAHGGYQYNRPTSNGLPQLGPNEGKLNQGPAGAYRPQGQQSIGSQDFSKPVARGQSQEGSRPLSFSPIPPSQGVQGPSKPSFGLNSQESTGPVSTNNQNQFGTTLTSQEGSRPLSFSPIPAGPGSQGQFRPSFGSNGQESTGPSSIGNQNKFGSSASSGPRPFMPQTAPYQYKQPESSVQGSQFPQPTSQTGPKQGSSTFEQDRSEFGGPRQPPSFSPEEGYKY